MIVNKSIHYNSLRPQLADTRQWISVQGIRENITQLNIGISDLQKKLNRNSLPSFSSREKRFMEIDEAKEAINKQIKSLDLKIRELEIPEPLMGDAIQTYFFTILKKIVILYRSIQQDNLRKHEVYNEYKTQETLFEDEKLLQMTVSRVSQIRQQIFNLTNSLIEIKMALKNQGGLIDRIDFYFSKSNHYLTAANNEIDKIPGNYTKYKDFIIYMLLYCISILLIMAIIKALY